MRPCFIAIIFCKSYIYIVDIIYNFGYNTAHRAPYKTKTSEIYTQLT